MRKTSHMLSREMLSVGRKTRVKAGPNSGQELPHQAGGGALLFI